MTLTKDLVTICNRTARSRDYKRAATHLVDWLGIVLATRGSEPEMAFGTSVGFPTGATMGLAFARERSPEAAFALGALGSLLEMDDLDRTSILHAGDTVCPAALCAALEAGGSGADLLKSLIAGYEVAIRIGRAVATGGYTAWYNSSVCGVFGAAMASGRALRLDPTAQAYALGHAGMQASGLWQARLEQGYAKQLATAHAARAGLTSAKAASAGLAAPLEILEGDLGFFNTFYPQASAAAVTSIPDQDWLLHEVSLKPWSACRHTHPAIAAALELRVSEETANDLRDVRVLTYDAAIAFCDNPDPQNAHEARFSLQHSVACALLFGPPVRAHFEDDNRRIDPTLAALRRNIELVENREYSADFPRAYRTSIEATDASGRSIRAYAPHAPGDPEAPLTGRKIEEKFLRNCRDGGVPSISAEMLLEAVRALPGAADLSGLERALSLIPAYDRKRSAL